LRVKTKAESVRLYESGFFGNKGLTWQTVEDYVDSRFEGPVVLRYRDPDGGGGPCVYNLTGDFEVLQAVRYYLERGCRDDYMWINAQMPDHAIVVQGEYWTADMYGLAPDVFYCSDEKLQMRTALESSGRHITKGAALELLRRRMDLKSWCNFESIMEIFPGHVIEVSVYSQPVGLLGWNSVVWEVRSY
jgi:hypothetical protein